MIHFALFALVAFTALTQDTSLNKAPVEDDRGTGFFSSGVDFWNTGGTPNKGKKTNKDSSTPPPAQIESIWAEPTRLPDGRYGIYVPPPAVLAFLESPTRESLQGYLAWRQERAQKLSKAMALLAEHRRSLKQVTSSVTTPQEPATGEAPALEDVPDSQPSPESADDKKSINLIYFTHPKCPACVRQNEVLSKWLKGRKNIALRVITFGQSPELWKEYVVTATPTMVFKAAGRIATVVGLKTADQLDATLSSLKTPEPRPLRDLSNKRNPHLKKGEKE